MVKCKKFILKKMFEGLPKESDVELVEEELPPLKDNEFMSEAVFLAVDPFFRAYPGNIGDPVGSGQVARIIESKNPKYPVGEHINISPGMVSHYVGDGSSLSPFLPPATVIPDLGGLPLSLVLGVLGYSGFTAYFGLFEVAKPKKGETVAVSAAAGSIGSIVGQLAKIKGCKVIGIVGSDVKGKWLISDLKFDGYVNYNNDDLVGSLKKVAPSGIDVYFDNVGGEISSAVMNVMNTYGRIAACGVTSAYNATEVPKASIVQASFITKQLKMEGFTSLRWASRFGEASRYLIKQISEGKLKYTETVTEGFDNSFRAFIEMLQGANKGRSIVKV